MILLFLFIFFNLYSFNLEKKDEHFKTRYIKYNKIYVVKSNISKALLEAMNEKYEIVTNKSEAGIAITSYQRDNQIFIFFQIVYKNTTIDIFRISYTSHKKRIQEIEKINIIKKILEFIDEN